MQVNVVSVKYFYIELSRHNVVLADGLPAETYLDTGSRNAFENDTLSIQLHPEFRPDQRKVGWLWDNFGYAPLLGQNGEFDRVRAMLMVQAALLSASDDHATASVQKGMIRKRR